MLSTVLRALILSVAQRRTGRLHAPQTPADEAMDSIERLYRDKGWRPPEHGIGLRALMR